MTDQAQPKSRGRQKGTPNKPKPWKTKDRSQLPAHREALPHFVKLVTPQLMRHIENVNRLAFKSKSDDVRLRASLSVLDRVYGKPVQMVAHAGLKGYEAPGGEAEAVQHADMEVAHRIASLLASAAHVVEGQAVEVEESVE